MNLKGLFIAFLLIIIAFLGAFSLISDNNLSIFLGKPKTLHQKLTEIYNQIPTETGKNLFKIQSKNFTKPVDNELVDLDSQIISCDANVNSLLSNSPSIGGSCTGPGISLSSTKGKFLGGQCCGVLKDTKEYHEQLEALKNIQTFRIFRLIHIKHR